MENEKENFQNLSRSNLCILCIIFSKLILRTVLSVLRSKHRHRFESNADSNKIGKGFVREIFCIYRI